MARTVLRSLPLRAGIACGFISILLDIDHPIAYYILVPATGWDYEPLLGRFLHFPVALACIVVLCFAGARIRRLRSASILRRKDNKSSTG